MNVSTTNIDGLLIIKPTIYGDERGYFFESYREDSMKSNGIASNFVQDNQSLSSIIFHQYPFHKSDSEPIFLLPNIRIDQPIILYLITLIIMNNILI